MAAARAERIVTLVPNATEIVFAVGAGDRLVGRSHECDYPAGVEDVPIVTAANVDSSRPSGEIDRDVRGLLAQALTLYDIDSDWLRALAPDLVVTQDLCDVCAVSLPAVERALAEMTGGAPALVSLKPARLADVWDDVRRVGAAVGDADAGEAMARDLARRVAAVSARVDGRRRPRVAALEWFDPLMAAGNWVPELIHAAGGEDVLGRAGDHAPPIAWDDLMAADPDIIVTMPCGFGIDRSRRELDALARRPEWSGLRAVREGRIFLTDGNQYFNRPGPRLADAAEILAEIMHADTARYGHEGAGWVRFQG